MNFKEIQLVGFKSFADKTTISFQDGVTCIVGPNGCGKSNVADAVRWVLGEQSAKTLRGSSMQDVIFNGTEQRRALSYCEVTLVFDNSERLFDIDYSEVAMTRRLYRSGDSEYLLNKQPCRLKDITALLHGVGIGKEGYSIIGQGRATQIMTAKPEDRRAIFEEAVGVTTFKQRKGEIERKIENAKDNLTVFVQRMDEVEKQLKPLAKQAETTIKYNELSEDLKYNEVNTFLYRADNASSETARFQQKVDKAEARCTQISEEIIKIEADEHQARERVVAADEELRILNEELLKYELGMENKSGKAQVINAKIDAYRRELHTASESIDYSVRRMKDIDTAVSASEKKSVRDGKRSEELQKKSEELTARLMTADERLAAYEKDFAQSRESQLSSVESLSEIRANTGSLSARKDEVGARIDEVRIAIEKAQRRRDEYAAQLEECTAKKGGQEAFLDGAEQSQETLNESVRDLTAAVQKMSREVAECESSIANFQHNLALYRDMKNDYGGYVEAVRRLQKSAQNDPSLSSKIKGMIADIVKTESKYEVAIETAFGGAMQNIVTANADDATFLINYLKRTNGGRVTFRPVASTRPRHNSREVERAVNETGALGLADQLVTYDEYYDNVIRFLIGNTLLVDTIDNAKTIARKYAQAFRIVTLDGDIVETNGAMTGGSRSSKGGQLLATERRIRECEENIARKQTVIEKLKKAIAQSEKDLEEASVEREQFRQKLQEATAEFAALSQRETVLNGLLADSEKDVTEYETVLANLTKRVENLQSEVLSASENEDVLNKIRSEAEEALSSRQAEIDALRTARNKDAEELQALRIEHTSLLSSSAAEAESVRRMQEEKRELEQKIVEARGKIAGAEGAIKQLKLDEEKVALTEEEQKRVASIRARIGDIGEEKKMLNTRQVDLGEAKRNAINEQQQAVDDKFKAELEISKIQSGLENWRERIMEMYELDYESAQPLRDAEYDITKSHSRINYLKDKIRDLGPVNPNAVIDYNETNERYTEMLTQKEDLDKGIVDLTGVLSDLKGEMQRRFDEGFNAINDNFKQVFRELFGGGKAEMQLDYTNCTDPLEAGVEIIACPPGKKLQKLSLLSGGEQSVTATAVLFAILKARPMPFCILDEIEAALDEANVDRVAKYIKKFSKDTQFIVITHRKPTMNQADCLFGVTMEEKGVSKVVSVKLSEVESKLGGDTVMV